MIRRWLAKNSFAVKYHRTRFVNAVAAVSRPTGAIQFAPADDERTPAIRLCRLPGIAVTLYDGDLGVDELRTAMNW